MGVRLSEVAERAGVSIATVSRVLNDRPGVHEDTRLAVLTAVDVLGYQRPSQLRRRPTGLVGLIVPELVNPFFPSLAQVIETDLARAGYTTVLCSQSLGGVHEDDYVDMLLDYGVSGIVFVNGIHAVAGCDPARYQRLVDRGMPVGFVNGFMEGISAAFVATDEAASVHLAVAHLSQLGHRRVGIALGQSRYLGVQRRIRAFADAMRAHVAPDLREEDLDAWVQCTWYTPMGGSVAAAELLDRGVTAIVCGSDLMALGAIQAARQRGLEVPADVSVVGSDDSVLMEFTDPPLTTVRQPVADLGAAVTRTLIDQIEGRGAPSAEIVLAPELVVRRSTAPTTP